MVLAMQYTHPVSMTLVRGSDMKYEYMLIFVQNDSARLELTHLGRD